jgi:hypothetical protein
LSLFFFISVIILVLFFLFFLLRMYYIANLYHVMIQTYCRRIGMYRSLQRLGHKA